MLNPEYEALLNSVSPAEFRSFRRLLEEISGYMKRGEYDKIKDIQTSIEDQLKYAEACKAALGKRLDAMHQQKGVVQKQTMYQQFLNPKTTILVTHPFPLPEQPQQEAPQPITEAPPAPMPDPVAPIKDADKKLDAVMADMAAYNQVSKQAQQNIPTDTSGEVDHTTDGQAVPASQNNTHFIKGTQPDVSQRANQRADKDKDGVSLSEDLKDERLILQEQKNRDAQRAQEIAVSDKKQKELKGKTKKAADTDSPDNTRRDRIWDQIKTDQSKGDIEHEL
jgi:hypothetical protein